MVCRAHALFLLLVGWIGVSAAVDVSRIDDSFLSLNKEALRSQSPENLYYIMSMSNVLRKSLALEDQEICKKLAYDFEEHHAEPSVEKCFFTVAAHQFLPDSCDLGWMEKTLAELKLSEPLSAETLYQYLYSTVDFPSIRKVSVDRAKEILEDLSRKELSNSELGYCLQAGSLLAPKLRSDPSFLEQLFKTALQRLKLSPSQMVPAGSSMGTEDLILGILEINDALSQVSSSTLDEKSVRAIVKYIESPFNQRSAKYLSKRVLIADRLSPSKALGVYPTVPVKFVPVDNAVSSLSVDVHNPVLHVSLTDLIGRPVESAAKLKLVSLSSLGEKQESIEVNREFEPKDSSRMVHAVTLSDVRIPVGSYLANIELTLFGDRTSIQHELVPLDFKTSLEVASISVKISSGVGNVGMHTLTKGQQLPSSIVLSREHDIQIEVNFAEDGSELRPKLENSYVCFEPETLADDHAAVTSQLLKYNQACFVPSSKLAHQHLFHVTGANLGSRILNFAGTYKVRFVAHHRYLLHSIAFDMGHVKCRYQRRADTAFASVYRPKKPLIAHTFKKPEPRPPFIVSALFSAMLAAPLLLLLMLWKLVGVNLGRCPFSISVPLYHIIHGASIAALCYCWAYKNMFFTIKAVVGLYALLFMVGWRVVINAIKKQ